MMTIAESSQDKSIGSESTGHGLNGDQAQLMDYATSRSLWAYFRSAVPGLLANKINWIYDRRMISEIQQTMKACFPV